MNSSRAICYLVWWEGATRNPLIQRQVIALLRHIREAAPDRPVHLLLAGAFAKARVRDRLRPTSPTAADLDRLREQLGDIQLHIRETWIAPRSKYFYARGPVQRHLAFGHRRWLQRFVREHDIGVLHCRSYPAMWAAREAFPQSGQSNSRNSPRLLFDTRGVYPEEGVITGCYTVDSAAYKLWKVRESLMCNRADVVVNVSQTFTEHMAKLAPEARHETIFTSTDLQAFSSDSPSTSPLEAPYRLVYLGGIGVDGWHTPEYLAWHYKNFCEAFADKTPKLRIITRSPHDALQSQLTQTGIPADDIELMRTNSLAETVAALRECRYASIPLRPVEGSCEEILASTILASKSGEYLAAGLPLLCNAKAGGISHLTQSNKLGLAVAPSANFAPTLQSIDQDYPAVRQRCLDAAQLFDIRLHAKRYLELYDPSAP